MTLFGEYLNQMIRSREMSISRLARETGVERTAIHKALNGDRILPYPAVESLARYLKLSPGEAKKLHQYYDLLFESENTGRARKIVRKMFLRLSGQPFSGTAGWWNPQPEQMSCSLQDKSMYKGYGQIICLIRFLIAEEMRCDVPKIELALPPDVQVWQDCMDWFSTAYSGRGEAEFSHIVCLEASGDTEKDDLHNLEALSSLVPGCILPGQRYHIYYYYSDRGQAQYTDPLPYFLVTHAGAVCFSPNCQAALSFRAEEQIAYFHACFSHLKKSCHRLVEYLESSIEITKAFGDITAEGGGCAILPQPWFQKALMKDWTILFPQGEILDFLETGKLSNPLTGTVDILPDNRRDWVLREFLDALYGNSIKGRIINDGMFAMSRRFLMVASSGGVLLCDDRAGRGIRIQESVFCRAVRDWVVHISDSDEVFDEEETIEILTEGLRVRQNG